VTSPKKALFSAGTETISVNQMCQRSPT